MVEVQIELIGRYRPHSIAVCLYLLRITLCGLTQKVVFEVPEHLGEAA